MDARIEITLVIEGQPNFGSVGKTVVKNVTLTGDNPEFLAAEVTKRVLPKAGQIMSAMVRELSDTYGNRGLDTAFAEYLASGMRP